LLGVVFVLATQTEDGKADQYSHDEDDKENDDQGHSNAEWSGSSGCANYRARATSGHFSDGINVRENAARAIEGLDLIVDGEIGQTSAEA